MDEFREIRVALLLIVCLACLFNIGQTIWHFYGGAIWAAWFDVASRWWS